MYKQIASIEFKGRLVRLLKKSGIYRLEDNKDPELYQLTFINEREAVEMFHEKIIEATEKKGDLL